MGGGGGRNRGVGKCLQTPYSPPCLEHIFSVFLSLSLSVCLNIFSVSVCLCLSVCLYLSVSTHSLSLSVCLHTFSVSLSLSLYVSIHSLSLSVCLNTFSVCLSLSVCLCLSVCLSLLLGNHMSLYFFCHYWSLNFLSRQRQHWHAYLLLGSQRWLWFVLRHRKRIRQSGSSVVTRSRSHLPCSAKSQPVRWRASLACRTED